MAGRSGARAWWWSGPVGPPSDPRPARLGRHQTDLGTGWGIKALTSATGAVGLATGPVTAPSWTVRGPTTMGEEDAGAIAVVAAVAGAAVGTGHTAHVAVVPAQGQGRQAVAAAGLAAPLHVTAG
ncbi:hypothetical protein V5799_013908 [Amblyomma americanum]|uniref:Uncharacterized protein n=1 Tax=Amblyomma americanum TaxID=6943 RepID=A0AAQ4E4L4_AMBAM